MNRLFYHIALQTGKRRYTVRSRRGLYSAYEHRKTVNNYFFSRICRKHSLIVLPHSVSGRHHEHAAVACVVAAESCQS